MLLQLFNGILGLGAMGAGDRLDGATGDQFATCLLRSGSVAGSVARSMIGTVVFLPPGQLEDARALCDGHAGQEYIWQKVWAQFNISAADLETFFAGPAFLAWQRMGNLRGYGGPLPQSYIDDQAGEIPVRCIAPQ